MSVLGLSLCRKSALEQGLTEKQDILSRLADCLAWLNQAELHLGSQKPLGSDYYTVHEQYEAQQVSDCTCDYHVTNCICMLCVCVCVCTCIYVCVCFLLTGWVCV